MGKGLFPWNWGVMKQGGYFSWNWGGSTPGYYIHYLSRLPFWIMTANCQYLFLYLYILAWKMNRFRFIWIIFILYIVYFNLKDIKFPFTYKYFWKFFIFYSWEFVMICSHLFTPEFYLSYQIGGLFLFICFLFSGFRNAVRAMSGRLAEIRPHVARQLKARGE